MQRVGQPHRHHVRLLFFEHLAVIFVDRGDRELARDGFGPRAVDFRQRHHLNVFKRAELADMIVPYAARANHRRAKGPLFPHGLDFPL